MKKVKLIRVHIEESYSYSEAVDQEIITLVPESEVLEVTDEEYDLLTDYRVRNKIKADRGYNYYDKLILLEDKTSEIPTLITSAKEILEKIKKTEAAEKKKREEAVRKARETAAARKIAKAKQILKEAGELK